MPLPVSMWQWGGGGGMTVLQTDILLVLLYSSNDEFLTLAFGRSLQTSDSQVTEIDQNSLKGKKILGGKEKMLVKSIFSFSDNLFKRLVGQSL